MAGVRARIFPLRPMTYRSVTFDLDGTLVDSLPDLAAASHAALAELGLPPRSDGDIARFVGQGMASLVERCLTWDQPPAPAQVEQALVVFRRHYAHFNGQASSLFPGVKEGLDLCRAQGLALGVVTNKPEAFTFPLLEQLGLTPYFSCVVGGDTTPHRKPHPEPLIFACRALGTVPAANVHVGDSVNDFRAARAAGCPALAVPYGYNEGRPVDRGECDALVSDLVAAARWIVPGA